MASRVGDPYPRVESPWTPDPVTAGWTPAPALTPDQKAVVARFEAADAAPESWKARESEADLCPQTGNDRGTCWCCTTR